ncbi:MAG: alpha/beta hydrolase-fold protein [Ignavibacteriaceae bacterium]
MYKVIFILFFIYPVNSYTQGIVEFTSFYSNSLEENRSVYVYLPEGYDPGGSTDYPVVYFLHGGGFGSYQYIHGILDNLIGSGVISPVIFVQPDGTGGPYYGGFYTNSELNGNFEDYGAYDVVEFIDANYRTIPSPESRSIMGHSWGAYSSMKLALKHPDIFGVVAAHSGTPDLNVGVEVWRPHVLAENGGSPPYNFNPNAGVFSISIFGWAGAFSPNMTNPPFYVDFPLNSSGDIIDSVMVKWQQHNPTVLASQLSPNANLTIYFDCGTYDEFECYPMNTAFADSLDQLEIPYTFQSYSGSHFNQLPDRFAISLTFLVSVMIPTTVESSLLNSRPGSFILYQNYPNPFNPTTTISYQLPGTANVKIILYNVLGQKIKTLVNEELNAGYHEVIWKSTNEYGSKVTSGTYIYRMQTGDFVDTKKLILLR